MGHEAAGRERRLQSEGGILGVKSPNTEQCKGGEGIEQIKTLGLHFQRNTCACGNGGHHWSEGLQGNFII